MLNGKYSKYKDVINLIFFFFFNEMHEIGFTLAKISENVRDKNFIQGMLIAYATVLIVSGLISALRYSISGSAVKRASFAGARAYSSGLY